MAKTGVPARQTEKRAALVLLTAVMVAIVIANLPLAHSFQTLLEAKLNFGFEKISVHHFINDGLMAIFFLGVGLELKKEMLEGALSDPRKAVQPMMAAVAGMAVPALIYVAFNYSDRTALQGWAIPAATDIAFALGVLAFLGDRIRPELRIFLLALAVADDLGAILVIAFFYSDGIAAPMLGGAVAVMLLLFLLNRIGVKSLPVYLALGLLLWVFMLKSGVHATLAGVLLAFTIPHRIIGDSKLVWLEHALKPWVSFLILPIFAIANAGVAMSALSVDALSHPVSLGAMLGLMIGKPFGILVMVLLAAKLFRENPVGSPREIIGLGAVAGIGFTMSLFIGGLAFRSHADLFEHARAGIYIGSVLSAVLGLWLLSRGAPEKEKQHA